MSKKKKGVGFMNAATVVTEKTSNYEEHLDKKNQKIEELTNELIQSKKEIELSKNTNLTKNDDITLEKLQQESETLEKTENFIAKLVDKRWEMAWAIGYLLNTIQKEYLDSTEYKTITDYSYNKYGFEPKTTLRFMFISDNFDLETARSLGSKLRLLQPLDIETRKKYLEWMKKENPSFRQIEERIKSEFGKPKIAVVKNEISVKGDNMNINLNALGFNSIYYRKLQQDKKQEFIEKLKELFKEYLKE